MSYVVDFINVSPVGLESSPVSDALAGLRANEARYFKNKYDHDFTVTPASGAGETIDWVSGILKDERDIVIASPPLEASEFEVGGIRMAYVFYASGLSDSNSQTGWRSRKNLRRGSSSRDRSRSSPAPSAGLTSRSRARTDRRGAAGRRGRPGAVARHSVQNITSTTPAASASPRGWAVAREPSSAGSQSMRVSWSTAVTKPSSPR